MSNLQILFIGLVVYIAIYIVVDRVCKCIENIKNTKNMSNAFKDWIKASDENSEVLHKSNGVLHKSNENDKMLL